MPEMHQMNCPSCGRPVWLALSNLYDMAFMTGIAADGTLTVTLTPHICAGAGDGGD